MDVPTRASQRGAILIAELWASAAEGRVVQTRISSAWSNAELFKEFSSFARVGFFYGGTKVLQADPFFNR